MFSIVQRADIHARLLAAGAITALVAKGSEAAPNIGNGGTSQIDGGLKDTAQQVVNMIWNAPLDIVIVAGVLAALIGLFFGRMVGGSLGVGVGLMIFACVSAPLIIFLINKKNAGGSATGG